jgi:hypothetical protein
MTLFPLSQTTRDILSLLWGVGYRLAQGAALTLVIVVAFALLAAPACGCVTKEKAYIATMKSDLRNVITAQEAFYADHERFASTHEELATRYLIPSTGVTVVIEETTPDGWRAAATHSHIPWRCAIFVGGVTPPRTPPSKNAVEGEPICFED